MSIKCKFQFVIFKYYCYEMNNSMWMHLSIMTSSIYVFGGRKKSGRTIDASFNLGIHLRKDQFLCWSVRAHELLLFCKYEWENQCREVSFFHIQTPRL